MPTYKDAINKVLEHEGGFVNHPNDRGGPTNLGVTIGTLSTYLKRPATIADVQAITKATAVDIYKKLYWDKIGGDQIKLYSVAAAIFDQAINRGHVSALKQAQKIVGVTADGVIGAKTIAAINAVNDQIFLPKYLSASAAFYNKLATDDPSQMVFLQGWLNRITSLQNYVYSYIGVSNGTVVGIGAAIVVASVGGYFLYNYLTASTPRIA